MSQLYQDDRKLMDWKTSGGKQSSMDDFTIFERESTEINLLFKLANKN